MRTSSGRQGWVWVEFPSGTDGAEFSRLLLRPHIKFLRRKEPYLQSFRVQHERKEKGDIRSLRPLPRYTRNLQPDPLRSSQYEGQPPHPAANGQSKIPQLMGPPGVTAASLTTDRQREGITEAISVTQAIQHADQRPTGISSPSKIETCSHCKNALTCGDPGDGNRRLCDLCLKDSGDARKVDRIRRDEVNSSVLQIQETPASLNSIESSKDIPTAASSEVARLKPVNIRQPLQSLPIIAGKDQAPRVVLEENRAKANGHLSDSFNHVMHESRSIEEGLSDTSDVRKGLDQPSNPRKRRLPWVPQASHLSETDLSEQSDQPIVKRIRLLGNQPARTDELKDDASNAAKTSTHLDTEAHRPESETHKQIEELRRENTQLKKDLAVRKSALRNYASSNAALTTKLREKEDSIKQKDQALQVLRKELEDLRIRTALADEHNVPKSGPGTQNVITTDADDTPASRLAILDAALLAQQSHRKQGCNRTETPVSQREYVSINPLEAYSEFGINPSEENRGSPVKAKLGRKATFGQRQACYDSSKRNDDSHLESVESSIAFEEMLGIPKNPVPVVHIGRLAIRDGTLGPDGYMPRARNFLYLGSKVLDD
ncbi:MAG: hypothetical protein M1816_007461 [Peltula sp. TS41687]|nr:MAG: hypothetical protein M1816_007461 [Peltula sp. TS41687]